MPSKSANSLCASSHLATILASALGVRRTMIALVREGSPLVKLRNSA